MDQQDKMATLREWDQKHFLHPTSSLQQQAEHGPSFIFTKGEGVYLYNINGKKVIDGMSSLWNVNIGHGRKEIAAIAMEQMGTLAYSSCFSTFSNEPAIKLAQKLASIAPGDLEAVFFTSGGSESNDTAYKLARHYWMLKGEAAKKKIISRNRSYHGVALGSTSATGLKPFRDFTNSLAPDFLHVDAFSTASLQALIEKEGAENIAAFLAEPVQGAGGVHIASKQYFQEVADICKVNNILFITDEVITGFGRTGEMFAVNHYDVVPDMMCFAKGITSGYAQLGGVMLSKQVFETFQQLSEGTLLHGYTYSGHPTACAIALKNIEIIENENLCGAAREHGKQMLAAFYELQKTIDMVGEVRALGLMGAIELVQNQSSSELLSPQVTAEAAKRGLICRSVTFDGQDTVVFAPPLSITAEEMLEMLEIIRESILAVEERMMVV